MLLLLYCNGKVSHDVNIVYYVGFTNFALKKVNFLKGRTPFHYLVAM